MIIFAIDDSRAVLSYIKKALEAVDARTVVTFTDPVYALQHLQTQPADLLLVDYNMPQMNGIELILKARALPKGGSVPIIMLTSVLDPAIKSAAIEAGATEFLTKPIDPLELSVRVRNLLHLRRTQKDLERHARALEADVRVAMTRIANQEHELIWRLSKAMACRDGETALHVERVAVVARMIAQELGLDQQLIDKIYKASPLHDVGKIGVPDSILLKEGRLSSSEMDIMRSHAAFGAELLADSDSDVIQIAASIAESHHEKWDGSGYPNGLAATDIPIEGRIVAIADVFDALCSERPYKMAWPTDEAHREIARGSGTHFDPTCVAAFNRRWTDIQALYSRTIADGGISGRDPCTPTLSKTKTETAA